MAGTLVSKATTRRRGMAQKQPNRMNMPKKVSQSLCLSYSELWGTISGNAGTSITSFDFAPGDSGLQRLDAFASLYDQYQVKSVILRWTPAVGTLSAGRVLMAVDYVNSRIPTSEQQLATYEPRFAGAVWSTGRVVVDVARAMKAKWMYCSSNTISSEVLLSAFGVHVFTDYQPTTGSFPVAGELWCDYIMEFVGPTFSPSIVGETLVNGSTSSGGFGDGVTGGTHSYAWQAVLAGGTITSESQASGNPYFSNFSPAQPAYVGLGGGAFGFTGNLSAAIPPALANLGLYSLIKRPGNPPPEFIGVGQRVIQLYMYPSANVTVDSICEVVITDMNAQAGASTTTVGILDALSDVAIAGITNVEVVADNILTAAPGSGYYTNTVTLRIPYSAGTIFGGNNTSTGTLLFFPPASATASGTFNFNVTTRWYHV